MSNHLLSKVFRFHYHSQKVIGSLGHVLVKLEVHWTQKKTLLAVFSCFIFNDALKLHDPLKQKPSDVSCVRAFLKVEVQMGIAQIMAGQVLPPPDS